MKQGSQGIGGFATQISERPEYATRLGDYLGRLSRLLSITDTDLHIEQVTGADKTLDVVVDVHRSYFNHPPRIKVTIIGNACMLLRLCSGF